MTNSSNSPWDFANDYDKFHSPDMSKWLEYAGLHEVNQGGPLAGAIALLSHTHGAIISDWAAGPPVWDEYSLKVAFPIWNATLFKGRFQRLVVVDTKDETITVFAEKFRVLRLYTFEKNIISGQDSPLHETKEVFFNALNSKIKSSQKYQLEERSLFPGK